MSNLLHIAFSLCLLVFALSPAMAAPANTQPAPAALVQQLQSVYQRLHSLQFDFAQVTDSAGRIREGNGFATFYRTGKTGSADAGIMRWDYVEPTSQVILNNGHELSIYTPQDRQLIVTPVQEAESDITYALFTGTKKLVDEFIVSPPNPAFFLNDPPADMQAVLLIPRQPHPQIKRLQLWLDNQSVLHRLLMEDHFGALSELTFTRVRFDALPAGNARQKQGLLQLDLLPGTEVIHQ